MAKMDNTALTAMDARDILTTMMIFDNAVECVTPVERFMTNAEHLGNI